MATTKISATKSTSRAINYAEKRAVEKSGLNCDVDYAKSSFKASRELYGKTDGNQGHVIIQSFKPGEVTPKQCNQLGLALAEKLAPNHQVAVYTHNDTDHVHNHIVINSIDLETGKKFNNNKQALRNVRDFNDEVCLEHGLSVPDKDTARLRYTQTEKAIADPNTKSTAQYSWKDEIREVIDQSQATNMDEFKDHLNQHGITIERVTPKSITYRHLAEDKKVRGRKLGEDYNKGGIEDGFERQIQQRQQERDSDTEFQPKRPTSNRDESTERDTGVTQSDWDQFAQDTNELERRRQAAESARLVDEKARRDREERARKKQASRRIINNDRDHDLEL
ncbi:TPA: relaxase/mobilization nuclease domain-containing protein [Staphylococcus aureus]|uniref:relaxase/mobilization nuclease domain-containing protein n=3 Tax=Staphylococcus aureus TaxID=1280 RepID=UPI0020C11FFE|nr:relaxase/mobilization nuclease domain-containing protein [Staphylococcus aureus]MCK8533987.1 relaxase/mobilization nuclease domain-containing protein [Staphylococcus aureus]HCU9912815.1 relaxase/mobilization nuclease domain-containing protein [Staphylococcus aureus]HDF3726719.1 relaxase/mobilization nuclease domain-containing protein [Staphylococcus aureus]HDT6646361.1 relaxase/mobilization nuclease domain-containing protein [Staphylococcus aureus]HDX8231435.1 relaxase/mobilization nuclease